MFLGNDGPAQSRDLPPAGPDRWCTRRFGPLEGLPHPHQTVEADLLGTLAGTCVHGDQSGRVATGEIVAKRLPRRGEASSQKGKQSSGRAAAAQLESDKGRLHGRRRRERSGRHAEQQARLAVKLAEAAQQAESLAAARHGTLGHLSLHQEGRPPKGVLGRERRPQDGRGDVVREVPHKNGTGAADGSHKPSEVGLQDVSSDDAQVGRGAAGASQGRRQGRVYFKGDDPVGTSHQVIGEGSLPRPDLECRVAALYGSLRYPRQNGPVPQEVLAQLGASAHTASLPALPGTPATRRRERKERGGAGVKWRFGEGRAS